MSLATDSLGAQQGAQGAQGGDASTAAEDASFRDASFRDASSASTMTATPTADDVLKYGLLFPYKIKDVKLSDQEDQPTMKGRRNTNTRLIGIGEIKTIQLDSKLLRNWGNREKMGLRGMR